MNFINIVNFLFIKITWLRRWKDSPKSRRIYFQYWNPQRTHTYKSIRKIMSIKNFKRPKVEHSLHKRRLQMASKHRKRCSIPLVIWGLLNFTMRYFYIPIRIVNLKEKKKKKEEKLILLTVCQDVEQLELPSIMNESACWSSHFGKLLISTYSSCTYVYPISQ